MSLFDSEFYEALRVIDLASGKVVPAALMGAKISTRKGSGMEYSDFREYIPGDDIRHIDWNAYGRLGKLFLKQYLEEKESTINIAIDTSPSMMLPDRKLAAAFIYGAVIAYSALKKQDRVRIFFPLEKDVPREYHGAGGFGLLTAYLEEKYELLMADAGRNREMETSSSMKIAPLVKKGGSVYILSDFYPGAIADKEASYLAFRDELSVVFVQILGKEELTPELTGTNRLTDVESKAQVLLTASFRTEESYKAALKKFMKETQEAAETVRGTYIQINASRSVRELLVKA